MKTRAMEPKPTLPRRDCTCNVAHDGPCEESPRVGRFAPSDRYVPRGGRVTVERLLAVFSSRGEDVVGMALASHCERPVSFTAEIDGEKHVVTIGVMDDTRVTMPLDALVDVVCALCPPWLLRKRLGV